MIKYAFSILIFLSFVSDLWSQNLDSLALVFYENTEFDNDSIELETTLDYAFDLFYESNDSLEVIVDIAVKCILLSERLGKVNKQMTSMNLRAVCLRKLGRFDESLSAFDEIIELAQNNNNPLRAAQMMDNKANVYLRMNKYDKGLEIRIKVLDLFHELGDSNSISTSYSNIASLYLDQNDYENSKKYLLKGTQYITNSDRDNNGAHLYGNLAITYKGLGIKDSAQYYFLKCRALSDDIKYLQNDNESELAKFYVEEGLYEKALESYERLLNSYSSSSKSFSYHYYLLLAAEAHINNGQYDLAGQKFDLIEKKLFEERTAILMKYGRVGYSIKYNQEDYLGAFEDYRLFRDMNDTLRSIDMKSNFKDIESKYELTKKEKLIAEQDLQLRKRMNWIIALLALLILATVLYQMTKRKTELEKSLSEQKSQTQKIEIDNLKKENKIISMQSMIEGQEEERIRIARDLHDNIGSLMTTIKMKVLSIQNEIKTLEKINIAKELDMMITSASQEVRRISHQMTPVALDIAGLEGAVLDLEQQLLSHDIKMIANTSALDEIKDKRLSINIFRLIQEMTNNTIKHANANIFSIDSEIVDDWLYLDVADDGDGYSKDIWNGKTGLGISTILSRVEYLNGTILLDNENGTKYQLKIPLL